MTEQEIIALYFARKETAIQATQEKYGKLIHHIARNILQDDCDAEECTNDTYLSLWNAIPPEEPNNLTAYVCRVVRNISLKRLEHNTAEKRGRHLTVSLSELEDVLPDIHLQPDTEDGELGGMISDFLGCEKEDARNIFLRRYFFFDSIRDIAERYAFSEAKVKSTLFHTRNKLKQYLTERGVYV